MKSHIILIKEVAKELLTEQIKHDMLYLKLGQGIGLFILAITAFITGSLVMSASMIFFWISSWWGLTYWRTKKIKIFLPTIEHKVLLVFNNRFVEERQNIIEDLETKLTIYNNSEIIAIKSKIINYDKLLKDLQNELKLYEKVKTV